MKKAFIYFFCFFASVSTAQQRQLDSLNNVIKTAKNDTTVSRAYLSLSSILFATYPDTLVPLSNKALALVEKNISKANVREKKSYLLTKAAGLSNIGYSFYVKGQMEKAVQYFEQALKINEENGEKKEMANSLSNLGGTYQQMGQQDKALNSLEQALKLQKEVGDKQGMAFTIINIAAIYEQQGQIQRTLDYIHEGLKIEEEIGNKYLIATSFNNLGAIYVKQKQYDKGLDYYNRSLKIRESLDDKQGVATCLHNIAFVYDAMNDKEKSLDYNFKGLKIYEAIGDKRGIANSYHNIGSIYQKAGLNEKALDFFSKSTVLYEEMSDKRGLANSLNNIGATYLSQHKPLIAKSYVERALQTATEGGTIDSRKSAHFNLSRIDSALGNTTSAFDHYKKYIFYRDSTNNESTRKKAIKKQFEYEYEKKTEADKLEQEKKEAVHVEEIKRQKLIYISISGIIALGLLSVLLLFNRKRLKEKNRFQQQLNEQQKEQANAVMETQESERKRIAEDLHDSLGHLLSTVKLNLQTKPVQQKQVDGSLSLLNQATEEIRNITFNLMPRTLEEGGLIPALNELASKVTNAGTVKVFLHVHDMDKFVLEKQSQFNIYRIVQEAVNNILKHAAASEINIQVIGQTDHITIMIEDDGKGFNPETNKGGRGLKNIVTRSLWLKGNINIDSTPGKGTTITTEFPI